MAAASLDHVLAGHIEQAGNMVSGLDLSAIGKDGHAVANLLWEIASYLRRRDGQDESGTEGSER